MPDLLAILSGLSWPVAITLAWLAGEFGQRLTGLPRVSFYALAGFLLAAPQLGVLPGAGSGSVRKLADVAFGLILFELGYRINLRWLRTNPWIAASAVAEALLTFGVVFLAAAAGGMDGIHALMLASLCMATSPATVVRVINEQKSSGQVTERVLHLCALDCVLAVFAFNASVGLWIFHNFDDLGDALWHSLVVLAVSAFSGALFGLAVPALLRMLGRLAQDATVGFALAVILLVTLGHALALSPVVATLAFGLTARHRRVTFGQAQRNYGALGELLTVLLFVYAASTLDWRTIIGGGAMAAALMLARLLAKIAGVTAFARLAGISWRKGLLTGTALAPWSVFAILLLEDARSAGVQVSAELRASAALALLLGVLGPIFLQRGLLWARETPEARHAA